MKALKKIYRSHAALIIGTIGFVFLLASALCSRGFIANYAWSDSLGFALGSIGSTVLFAGFLSFLYENSLRDQFMEEMKLSIRETLLKDIMPDYKKELLAVVDSRIKLYTIPYYKRLKSSGVADYFDSMNYAKLSEKISSLDTHLKVSKIWLDSFETLELSILKAIRNGCYVQIVLLSPDCKEAITKRANSCLNYEAEEIEDKIRSNIDYLKRLKKRLKKDEKERLEVKTHRSFISLSYYQCGEEIMFGLYLHGRLSNHGSILKVNGDSYFGQEIKNHFQQLWDSSLSVFEDDSEE